jgi:hypothetical protein
MGYRPERLTGTPRMGRAMAHQPQKSDLILPTNLRQYPRLWQEFRGISWGPSLQQFRDWPLGTMAALPEFLGPHGKESLANLGKKCVYVVGPTNQDGLAMNQAEGIDAGGIEADRRSV